MSHIIWLVLMKKGEHWDWMCFEYDMSHIDSKPRIHRPRADQASQTGGGQTQFLKEGMAADADQRGPGMAIRKLVFEKIMGKLWFLTHFKACKICCQNSFSISKTRTRENHNKKHANALIQSSSGQIWVNPIWVLSKLTMIFPTMWVSTAGSNMTSR